ncbi:MAG: hypothetical protein KC502_19935, partial [Myxococcales bacterium]|nr:hypothetical protein [Myxococcales bacterium]
DLKAETPAVVRDAFAHSEDEQTKANEDGAPAPGSETVALRARAAADAVQTAPELDDQPTAALDAAAIAASRAAARRAAEVSATDAAAGGTIAEPATGSRGKVVAAIVGLVVVAACAVAFALLGLDRETPEPIAAKAAEQTKTSPGTNSAGGDAVVKRAHALVQAAMKEPDLAKREAELMAALVLTPKDAAFQALLKATREQRKSAAAAEAAQADKAKAQAQALAIEKAAAESLSAAQAAANKLAADKSKQGASSPTGAKAPAKAKPPTPAKPARRQPPVARKPAAARKPVARKPVAPKPAALKPAKKQADDAPFMDF